MKNLRKKLLVVLGAALLVAAPVAQAQSNPEKPLKPAGTPGDRLKMMKEELGLTPAQVDQIKPVFKAEMESMKALRDDQTLDAKAKREKMREARQKTQAAMKGILNADQLAKLDAMRPGAGKKKED